MWYLTLQLFGSNRFRLQLIDSISEECDQYKSIAIVSRDDSLSIVETNYMNRVVFAVDKRKAQILYKSQIFFDCINQSDADLVLVNEKGLWGSYSLSREGVDQLLTELDILSLQESYGKESRR